MTMNDAATGAMNWMRAWGRVQTEIARAAAAFWLGSASTKRDRPSARVARERYRAQAPGYDLLTLAGEPYRDQTVETLDPKPGEAIVDVGCGTGLNFAAIEEGIGSGGTLVGVDVCPEMLSAAAQETERHGWQNVTLIAAPADLVELPVEADAALFCGTHDVLRSPAALDNVLHQLRPDARVVAAGPKWTPPWRLDSVAMNAYTRQLHEPFVTTFEGFDRPWSHLERLVPDLQVEECFFGGGYIAAGTWPGAVA
jgi:ubiquinone/menaquinone biosynthesis C-methylase UbiE